jgi:hypothetical protein
MTLVRDVLRHDIFEGHLFIFFTRRQDRVRVVYWDRDGIAMWTKRIERGRFEVVPQMAYRVRLARSKQQSSGSFSKASIFGARADVLVGNHQANETSASGWSIERSDRSTDLLLLFTRGVTSEGLMQ